MITQFLPNYNLIEVKWYGMTGLFPKDNIEVMQEERPQSDEKLLQLAKRELDMYQQNGPSR